MLFRPNEPERLDRLAEQLQCASTPDHRLFSDIVAACPRAQVLAQAGKTRRLDQLIKAGAWTDAALALIELELPAWKVRRVIYDDGQWHCRLSARPNLPEEFDDYVEAAHDVLALAVLEALVEARHSLAAKVVAHPPAISGGHDSDAIRICCDDFA